MAMTKTKLSTYHFKNSTLDREKVRQAIIEVYGENLFTDEWYAPQDDDTDDNVEDDEEVGGIHRDSDSIKNG
jgi:hypothetical protein